VFCIFFEKKNKWCKTREKRPISRLVFKEIENISAFDYFSNDSCNNRPVVLSPISRMSLLHNTTHAYIAET
jgi:hypothetical protein